MTQVSSQNFKGFSPKIWGPSAWKFIHTIALSYPDNPTPFDKENYKNFFLSLKKILPCDKCRYHYNENIKNLDIYFDPTVDLANKFLLRGLPTTILINKKGQEFARIIGYVDFNDQKFINWLKNFN